MTNVVKLKRGSGSDPSASDMVVGEPVIRTDTAELFFKKDDGTVAKVSGGGGGPDFKYLALRNAANNGAASYPAADFTLVTDGTTTAVTPAAAATLLVSYAGVIQQPSTGTSTPANGFALSGSTIKFSANIAAAPDFIIYQESGGIGEPSDNTVSEAKLNVSNSPTNGYFLSAQSGNTGGLTWAAAPANDPSTGIDFNDNVKARWGTGNDFEIYHNGTHSYIKNKTGDFYLQATDTEIGINILPNSRVELYYDNSKKLETTSSGISVTGDVAASGNVDLEDNKYIKLGTGDDFQLGHTSSINYINIHADLLIRNDTELMMDFNRNAGLELYYDGSKKLETTSTGVTVSGKLTTTDDILCGDNVVARFGSSQDLTIYHNGSSSFISDVGTGSLKITTNGTGVDIQKDSSETIARFIADDKVELYYDNSKKFETKSYGCNLVGNLHMTSADNQILKFGGGDDLQIYHDGTNSQIHNATGILKIRGDIVRIKNAADSAYTATFNAGGNCNLYYDGSKKLETTSAGAKLSGTLSFDSSVSGEAINLADNQKIYLGAGDDLQIYHDGSNSYISEAGTGSLYIKSSAQLYLQSYGGENFLKADANGAVELYYDNSKKFETSSTGAKVSGRLDVDGNLISYSANNNSLGLTGHRWNDLFIANDIDILDNSVILIGTGNDLNIWHDGSNSNIENQTGQLRVRGSYIFLRSQDAQETHAQFTVNGASELFYDNSKKAETVSDGFLCSGNLRSNQHIYLLSDSHKLQIGAGQDLQIYHDGGGSYVANTTGILRLQAKSGENSISLHPDGQTELYYDHVKRLETTANGIWVNGALKGDSLELSDSKKIKLGTSQDLQIYHDGSNSYIKNDTAGLFIQGGTQNNSIYIRPRDGENSIQANSNGSVDLYYDNEKVLSTTATGAIVENTNGNGELTIRGSEGNGAQLYLHCDDGDDNEDKWRIDTNASNGSFGIQNYGDGGWEKNIECNHGDNVELYFDNSKKFEIVSAGTKVFGNEYITEGTIYLEKSGAHHHRILANDAGNDLAFQQSSATGSNSSFTTYLRIVDGGAISLPQDSQQLRIGAGDDIQLYHISGVNYWKNQGSTVFKMVDTGGDTQIECNNNGATKLFHNGSNKLETTSSGVTVTGSVSSDNTCHCFVEFDSQGSASINKSFGVSSVARRSNGNFTVNFSTAVGNTNYATVATSGANMDSWADGYDDPDNVAMVLNKNSSYVYVGAGDMDNGAQDDPDRLSVVVYA